MTDFFLLHGAFHGAWCWERLAPCLKEDARVRQVVAIDLAGHGARREEGGPHVTLEDYLQDIASAVIRRDLRDVVMVGHSFAGVLLPRAAARVQDRVRRLVFLAAMTPAEGKTGRETARAVVAPSRPGATPEDSYRQWFCSDMDEETARWVLERLTPTALAGMDIPVSYRDLPGNMPITYIVFTQDQSIPAAAQRKLAVNLGTPEVLEIDAGRDAMISRPRELARLLLRYA